ncbi:MAG: choice-of-anchor J domain-containing protein [Bacteroidetes bacterium]|nr:choice-of-anchor J domain-containing protein [Bacteroidota bacterium]
MKKNYFLISIFTLFSFLTYAQGPWNFNGSNDIWESTGTAANLTSGASFSTLDVNGAGNPMLRTFSANINASAVTHAVITLKNNTANKHMRVFYQTTGTNRYVDVAITANDADFVSYYVDMTGNADWAGTVNDLTFQFRENSSYNSALDGTIDIDNIEMTSSDLGVNMVNNSSFENWNDDTEATPVDPVGFYKHQSVERSSDSHSGDYSIKVIATSRRDLAQTVNEITAGATYRVSINYKLEASTGTGVRLWSTWKDALDASLASSDLQPSGYLNTVSSEWATFSVDAVAPENATKLNFEVRSYEGATVYWDSFSVSKVAEPDPCDGVIGAPAIADDFDGNSVDILEYVGDNAATFATVDGTPFGSTSNVLQYVDNGGQYANIQLRTCNKFDMAVTNYFTLDVYLDSSTITGTSPNQVQFKLQNRDLAAPWEAQVVATATVDQLDTWQTLVFDFNLIAGALDRTDIDNVVIQVNGENNNDQVTAYIDNITSTAGAPATNYNVTFEVDANNILVGDRGMYLGGGMFGGSDTHAMSDNDGDGVWSVTLELPSGTEGAYAFLNSPFDGGDWGTKENITGLSCAYGPWNDRYFGPITEDTTISFCFATCETSCTTPVNRYDVTFEVGTANETVNSGVFLGGGVFNGAKTFELFDADGDGIYARTLSIPEGTAGGFKFAIDPENHWSYSTSENFAGDCTEGQYNDRPLALVTEATTYSYCFGSCEAASTCALDTTAPVIDLIGDNPQEINNGDAYTELGATATDDVDGDISANIVIDSSAVDTSVDGSYTVTYDVSDAAGNEATQVTRTVNVSTPLTCTNLESFESFPPLDWTLTSSNTSNSITQSTSYAVTGSNSLRFSSYSSASTYDQYAVTPQLVTTAGDQTISFYHKASSTFGDETFKVGWSTTGNDVSTDFTWSDELISTTTEAQYVKTDLPVGTTYVAIHYYSNYLYYMYVDDFCTPALFVPDCVAPITLVASNITTTSADISWTSDASNFNVEYGADGFTLGTGVSDTSTSASYTLASLSANTSYDVYVQTDCSGEGNGVSDWVGPLTITTLCDTVTSFPYTHGFETLDCWTNSDASAAWALDAGDDYGPGSVTEGSSAVFFNDYDYSSGSTSDLMSPNLDLSVLTIARLTFDYYDAGGSDIVEVLVDNGSGPVVVYTTAASVTPWTTITVDLPVYAGQTVQIGFRGTSVWGTSNPHIDNLTVAEAPSCLDPTAITASDVTTTSAEIDWTAGGTETAWNIEWGTTGFILGEGTSGATTSPAYSLSGLTPNQTGYDFYVQADCGGDTSGWAGPFTFYTACGVFSGAWSNDFETDTLCWLVVNQGDPNGWGLFNNSTDGGGAFSFGIQYSTTAHDDYLISPAFSVIDGTSDRFTFDARNQSASFPELFNVQVLSVDLGTMLGTLASQINATGVEFETFSYDLSDYEGQDVRVAIHATDTNQWVLYIDNVVVDATLGIDNESMTLFNYFPNPVNDVLTIKAQNNVEDVKVFNMLGQMVLRQNPNSLDCTVDLSAMQTGAYFVQVSIGNRVETVRVLKK